MKHNRIFSVARLSLPLATALVALFNLTAQRASAINLYWDSNDTTLGAGATPTGTWGTSLFWSTDSTGSSATANTTTTGVDDLFFSAGTDAVNPYVVTVIGSQNARLLTFEEGTATLSGGTLITLAGGGGITVGTGTTTGATVSTALTLNGNNIFNIDTGRTLTLDTGAFNRSTNRATLNIQGAGTVISTMTGLATNTNRILGPWASFDTAGNTTYAAFNGTTLGGLTYATSPSASEGTLVTLSTDVVTGAGNLNYSLNAAGTLGASANINTLRYTGAAGSLGTSTSFTTLGIMNSGTGLLTFSGAVTSGSAATEMVVNTANNDIRFDGILTGTITKTGSGTMTLGLPAHNLGGITVNQGTLIADVAGSDALPSATINNGGTLRWAFGGKFSNSALFTINAGGTLDTGAFDDLVGGITGSGTVTGTGGTLQISGTQSFAGLITGGKAIQVRDNGNQTLSGLNTYTGTTTIGNGGTAGTLRINSVANAGNASAIGSATGGNSLIRIGDAGATGTLVYTGTGHSTDRQIQIGAGTSAGHTGGSRIQSSGAGILEFTNTAFNVAVNTGTGGGNAARVLTLGGTNTGNNRIAGAIVNNLQNRTQVVALVKEDAGTWILGGNNTYTGKTTVSGGTLQVTGNLGSGTYNANIDIASGATFQHGGGGQTLTGVIGTGGGTLSKAGGTDLILTNNNAYGTLNISAGRVFMNNNAGALPSTATVALSGGTLVFGVGATRNNAITVSSGASISARAATTLNSVTLPGSGSVIFNLDDSVTSTLAITNDQTLTGTLSVQVGGNATPGVATLSGIISGASGAITKTSTGTLALSGANTYAGNTTVSAGLLTLGNTLALQNSTLDTLNSIASSSATTGLRTTVTALTLGGLSGDKNLATLFNAANGYNTLTALTLNPDSLANPSYSGDIGNGNGSMTLTKTGAGTQTLTGANTYTGGTTVNQGMLTVGTGGTLGATTGTLSVNNTNSTAAGTDSVLNLATAVDTTTGSLSGTIATPTSGINTATINNGGSGRNFTVNQTAAGTYAGVIAGAGSLTLGSLSTNTLTLTGTNTYTGSTSVNAGTLVINGNQSAANGAVSVNGKLTGSGTVGGATTINSAGIHNAGDPTVASGVGSQTFSSTLNYANGSIFEWDLNSNSTASGFDTVAATGVTVGTTDTIFRVILGTTAAAGIADSGNAFWNTPFGTQTWTMASIFGAAFTSGAFQSVQTSTDVSARGLFTITASDLTWTAVPEPTSALAGILLAAGLLRRRRA